LGLMADLFFDGDVNSETLFNRVSLTNEQEERLKDKKDKIQVHLDKYLSEKTKRPTSFFIQGSYKNKTLIKPVRTGEEYDVDIGIYIHWKDGDADFEPRQLRDWAFEGMVDYSASDHEATVENNRKERCERFQFRNEFHLDMPVYHFEPDADERRLATLNSGWEESDPKLLQDWFVANTQEVQRHAIRRCIKYLKSWASLKWVEEHSGKLPSLAITVLVVRLWKNVGDDEDNLIELTQELRSYFQKNRTVENPVYPDQDILEFDDEEFRVLTEKIDDLSRIAANVSSSSRLDVSHTNWTYVFEHLLPPVPQDVVDDVRKNLPAVSYAPALEAVVYDNKTGRHIGTYKGDFSVPKDCTIRFRITNGSAMPIGTKLVWMVRNQGREASAISDLGHKVILNPNDVTERNTAYHGSHFMECYVSRNGATIGYDRIGVTVRSTKMPPRNPPKPAYTKIRR
jgi:hypothetical protein